MIMNRKKNRGMSLIELMIAMLIGLILLGGAATMFITNKRVYKEQAEMGLLQENARFALELIADNIRMAGYVGCHDDIDNVVNNLATVGLNDFAQFMAGTNGTNDSITVRYFQPFGRTTTADMGTPDSTIPIDNGANILENDIMAISDCDSADIFMNTNDAVPTDLFIEHAATGNTSTSLSKTYPIGSMVSKVTSRMYFIQASGNGTGPALWWNSVLGNEELVEGVERMKLMFGEDTSGNGSPNSFVNASGVTNWRNVVAVQIALLMRTVEEYGTIVDDNTYDLLGTAVPAANDRHRRRLFTTTVQVRNGMVGF